MTQGFESGWELVPEHWAVPFWAAASRSAKVVHFSLQQENFGFYQRKRVMFARSATLLDAMDHFAKFRASMEKTVTASSPQHSSFY